MHTPHLKPLARLLGVSPLRQPPTLPNGNAANGLSPLVSTPALLLALLLLLTGIACPAEDLPADSTSPIPPTNPVADYFRNWFVRVSAIQAAQPHWITPLVTVTPRLEEELRYDQMWESLSGGNSLTLYGGGKGLELIPFNPVELIIGVPSWATLNTNPAKEGWTDQSFLVKYRLLSANEQSGNYILTAFMGLTVPNGSEQFTSHHFSYTPTLAFGKGWGDFDFQSTLSVSVPDNGASPTGAGTPILFNTALQYRVWKCFWPELEANYTYWPNGRLAKRNQLFLTPGLVIGRLPIAGRLGLTFGAGCQFAVTDKPTYHRNVILTARLPF